MTDPTRIRRMLLWAGAGLIFIINAMITSRLIADQGFVAGLCGGIAVILLLIPLLNTILRDIRSGRMHMHELVVLAVLASCVKGDFLTSAWIALFLLLSMVIESRTASGAQASLAALARLTPGKARRLNEQGEEEEVNGPELRAGDRIRVRPGENILADGVILQGNTSINEANITGESLPADKGPESAVFAGTTNLTGLIELRVERAGPDTTLGRVRELITRAGESRLPFTRMIDVYIRYYSPLTLAVAGLVLFFTRHQPDALDRVVAVLVAACPIAIILATPTAVVASLAAAARLGVLIKDVNDIEALARIKAFMFDKTGTLTSGILEVARLTPVEGVEPSDLLQAAAVAEADSNHPVARAIQALAQKVKLKITRPAGVHEEPGRGVRVTQGEDEIIAGNLAWMQENGAHPEQFSELAEAETAGLSLLFVLRNGTPLGWIGISDSIRPGAMACIEQLRQAGIERVALVSGDRNQVVSRVGQEVKVDAFHGECTPDEKVTRVKEISENRRVVFVGDGVNDAPALAAADIGIAMGAAGSDVAVESATIALMNNELNRLPFLLRLARGMKRTVIQNFIVGAILIAGGVVLGATGRLAPVLAAGIQVLGALSVSMNSARLIRQGEELEVETSTKPSAVSHE